MRINDIGPQTISLGTNNLPKMRDVGADQLLYLDMLGQELILSASTYLVASSARV